MPAGHQAGGRCSVLHEHFGKSNGGVIRPIHGLGLKTLQAKPNAYTLQHHRRRPQDDEADLEHIEYRQAAQKHPVPRRVFLSLYRVSVHVRVCNIAFQPPTATIPASLFSVPCKHHLASVRHDNRLSWILTS